MQPIPLSSSGHSREMKISRAVDGRIRANAYSVHWGNIRDHIASYSRRALEGRVRLHRTNRGEVAPTAPHRRGVCEGSLERGSRNSRMRILIAEDDAFFQKLLRQILAPDQEFTLRLTGT